MFINENKGFRVSSDFKLKLLYNGYLARVLKNCIHESLCILES